MYNKTTTKKHERFISERKRQEPNVVFIGDSLIQLMQLAPVNIRDIA